MLASSQLLEEGEGKKLRLALLSISRVPTWEREGRGVEAFLTYLKEQVPFS